MLIKVLEAIGVFVVVALVSGFIARIVYYVLGRLLARHFFDLSLRYIKANGCGNDENVNAKAIADNLSRRLSSLSVAALVMASVFSALIGIFYRMCGDLPLAIGALAGLAIGIHKFYMDMAREEKNVVSAVGNLESLIPEEKAAIFRDPVGVRYKYSFDDENSKLYDDLVPNRGYYIADFIWYTMIANSNDAEWENDEAES